jgi:hypothetical protein
VETVERELGHNCFVFALRPSLAWITTFVNVTSSHLLVAAVSTLSGGVATNVEFRPDIH